MRLVVAVVGRPRDPDLAAAIRGYETRASRYWPLEVREVREEPARGAPVNAVREREGERLVASVPEGARVVACDETGDTLTSLQFAQWLQEAPGRARDPALVLAEQLYRAGTILRREPYHK